MCRLIKLILFFKKETTLREIVRLLDKIENKAYDRSYIYRIIKNRLISRNEVTKETRGGKVLYRLTPKGLETISGIRVTDDVIRALLIAIARELGGVLEWENISLENAFTDFNYVLEVNGREIYIRVEEGTHIPDNVSEVKSSEALKEMIKPCIPYLLKLLNEKILLGNIREDAKIHKDKRFLIIINGSDPRTIPNELRTAINDIAHEEELLTLKGAVKRINNLIEQLPENVKIVFTKNDLAGTKIEIEEAIKNMVF